MLDLNPTNHERASIVRDEVWIKEWLLQERSFITAVLRDFNRSGKNRDLSEADDSRNADAMGVSRTVLLHMHMEIWISLN
mmetsp:Transcript_11525/g.17535  ORF Transcript_11525/g.17535 Transcript_11525/m.17535 type:complete len:80 (-) Transcript_11525:5-244(-)